MSKQYYCLVDGQEQGPYSGEAVKVLIASGKLKDALIKDEEQVWRTLTEAGFEQMPTPAATTPTTPGRPAVDMYGLPIAPTISATANGHGRFSLKGTYEDAFALVERAMIDAGVSIKERSPGAGMISGNCRYGINPFGMNVHSTFHSAADTTELEITANFTDAVDTFGACRKKVSEISSRLQQLAASRPISASMPHPSSGSSAPAYARRAGPSHKGKAVTSLILGIGSLLVFLPAGVAAVLLGCCALSGISRSNNKSGKGFAIAGLLVGLLCISLWLASALFLSEGSASDRITGSISSLTGKFRTALGLNEDSARSGPGYKANSEGIVTSISGGDFFIERKEIHPDIDGSPIYFVVQDNKISECDMGSSDCNSPIDLETVTLPNGERLDRLCRTTGLKGMATRGHDIYLCDSGVAIPVWSSPDQSQSSSEKISSEFATLQVGTTRRLVRYRFTVKPLRASDGPTDDQRGNSRSASESTRPIEAAIPPSKCELIAQGEANTRKQCQSGNFNACREISGWVANKVMEGCSSTPSSSAPLMPTVQQNNDRPRQEASERAQPQPSSAPAQSAPTHEQQADVEASVDIASKNMNPPKYPPAAFRAGIQGEVGLSIDVDANGNVTNVSVEKSSRNRDLDRAAMDAARRWKFRPATVNGQQSSGRIRVPVTFSLGDSTLSDNGLPSGASLQVNSPSSEGFRSVYDAVSALRAHPDYSGISPSSFAHVDAASGLAELDASTQFFLPAGSADTLVLYTETNAGTPSLTVERYDGRQWRDVSAQALPRYVNRNGSNYYLDVTGAAVKVRSLPDKRGWRYSHGQFVPEA